MPDAFGEVMQAWAEGHRAEFTSVVLGGPYEAPGMDPTWVLDLETPVGSASACLFEGPYLDLGWKLEGEDENNVAGHEGFQPMSLSSILDDLARAIGAGVDESH